MERTRGRDTWPLFWAWLGIPPDAAVIQSPRVREDVRHLKQTYDQLGGASYNAYLERQALWDRLGPPTTAAGAMAKLTQTVRSAPPMVRDPQTNLLLPVTKWIFKSEDQGNTHLSNIMYK